jgi:UDP-GlcNAc:undecaprenyl-phosphate GlcNAc-1-phosphate transferase
MGSLFIVASSAVAMAVAMLVLAPTARRIGLVDAPDGIRKLHKGEIPLTGGPALLIVLVAILATQDARAQGALLAFCALTVLIGTADDRFGLSALGRLFLQTVLAIGVVLTTGLTITHLGDLGGSGAFWELGVAGPWITVGALVAAMNAFNMLDGTDGQASGLALVSIGGLATTAAITGVTPPMVVLALLGALPVFLVFNLSPRKGRLPKSFLGDSGALLLGLLVGWQLVAAAQLPGAWLEPVTVLWLAALPLFDTLFVMGYRLSHGRSPFAADRNHAHHLLRDHGFSRHGTLVTVLALAVAFAVVGVLLQWLATPEVFRFVALIVLFLGYGSGALLLHRQRPSGSSGMAQESGHGA